MTQSLVHRGPDSDGQWLDEIAGVALGHRRLAIVDLSSSGHQPMVSRSGRYVIVFNGELYNHLELRRRLSDSVEWHGHSDTESFIASVDGRGIDRTLQDSVGMFAFALWDRHERTLTLGRDRLGEKPLYYGWQGNTLLFGSELKALHAHPAFLADVDQNSVATFLKHGYVPSPFSIYKGIRKVPPGSIVTIRQDEGPDQEMPTRTYWSLGQAMQKGEDVPFRGDEHEAVEELERLLREAISGQLMSDVPLGAFLSGGIDSSTVVALLQSISSTPTHTFTVGFREAERDESAAARQIAQHLGTDHSELLVTPDDALAVIPKLATIYDEPFADASAVPTWLLAGFAREEVSVALSGDGGDELFAGYERYQRTAELWRAATRIPPLGRRLAASGLSLMPSGYIQGRLMAHRVGSFPHLFSDRVMAVRRALAADSVDAVYDLRMSHWMDPAEILLSDPDVLPTWGDSQPTPRGDPLERMMALDTRKYMSDGVLVKVDRASMSHSLESRVPLLDHRVVEFAWSLPITFRYREGTPKWLLRQVLYRHVPQELMDRPKKGFGIPLDSWLRGSLRPWAEDLLTHQALELDGPFRAATIRRLWDEHRSGAADWSHKLWPVLMYQAWATSWLPP